MKMYLPPPGKSGRRSFLKRGLFGGLLLAVGGGTLLAFRRSATVTVPEGLKVLDGREYALVESLVHCFVPTRAGFPSTEGTARAVDGIISQLDDSAKMETRQLFVLFENALPNFLFGGRTRPFTQLAEDEQMAVLKEWRSSAITVRRSGYLALRALVMAAYYGNPAVWPATKYPGPPKGIHDPTAIAWKGGDVPRPVGNGTWVEPQPTPPTNEKGAQP
jgi:hypothetical protein